MNRHPQVETAFHGEYLESAPPVRLVFTEIFEEFPRQRLRGDRGFHGGGRQDAPDATVQDESLEVRDMVLKTGMSNGAAISYDRLEDLLATLRTS